MQKTKNSLKTKLIKVNIFNKHNYLLPSRRNKYRKWVLNIIVAAVVTILIYLLSLYISHGTIFRPIKYTIAIELFFTFCYFLLLFLFYPKISRVVHSHTFRRLNSLSSNLLEGLIVVLATTLLTAIIKLFPLWLVVLFIEEVQMLPEAVRRNFIIHAVSGLFLYYFVERNRIRKRLQQERLNAARLEREKFHAQLQDLKDQVNPHFLFDSLETLTPLIKIDQEGSVEFVKKLSDVYRSFLAQNEKELVSLKEELKTVEAYFHLLKTNFGNTITIHTESLGKAQSLSLPPGILFSVLEQITGRKISKAEEKITMKFSAESKELKVCCTTPFAKDPTFDVENLLQQIGSRYTFFSDKKPEVFVDDNQVVVQIPLLKIENNESCNY